MDPSAIKNWSHTAFLSFLVKGLPDFVSSGGAGGGCGSESEPASFSASAASGSSFFVESCLDLPNSR